MSRIKLGIYYHLFSPSTLSTLQAFTYQSFTPCAHVGVVLNSSMRYNHSKHS